VCARVCTKENEKAACNNPLPQQDKCALKATKKEKETCTANYADVVANSRCIVAAGQTEGYCDYTLTDSSQFEATTKIRLGTNVQNKLEIRTREYVTDKAVGFVPDFVEYENKLTVLPFARESGDQYFITYPSNGRAKNVVTFELNFAKRSYIKETTNLAYPWFQALGDGTAIIGFFTGFGVWGGPSIIKFSFAFLGVLAAKWTVFNPPYEANQVNLKVFS
jgi:hypothetical protein